MESCLPALSISSRRTKLCLTTLRMLRSRQSTTEHTLALYGTSMTSFWVRQTIQTSTLEMHLNRASSTSCMSLWPSPCWSTWWTCLLPRWEKHSEPEESLSHRSKWRTSSGSLWTIGTGRSWCSKTSSRSNISWLRSVSKMTKTTWSKLVICVKIWKWWINSWWNNSTSSSTTTRSRWRKLWIKIELYRTKWKLWKTR